MQATGSEASPPGLLVVICGATATGKSSLAIALAQQLRGVILGADSRQVYREFDIGTAKPSLSERQLVPHYLMDIRAPTEPLTLADYQQQAQGLIANFHAQTAVLPLLVGGTGLYIRSVVRGLAIPKVPPQANLRSQLQSLGQPWCYQLLQNLDPAAAVKIHPNDPTRTIRALEVFYTTGKPISAQQGETPPRYPILQIGLDCLESDKEDGLAQRIALRTQRMIDDGFVAEVETLCHRYGVDFPLLNTLGYQEIKHYLMGKQSRDEAIALMTLHTRQFAKRQRTWFRADPTIEWFDSNAPDLVDATLKRIQTFLQTARDGSSA
jgi:tRNA dimethylallyltransferase